MLALSLVERRFYLCISPAADPIDRHNNVNTATTPNSAHVFGFRRVCNACLLRGNLALAAFHE